LGGGFGAVGRKMEIGRGRREEKEEEGRERKGQVAFRLEIDSLD